MVDRLNVFIGGGQVVKVPTGGRRALDLLHQMKTCPWKSPFRIATTEPSRRWTAPPDPYPLDPGEVERDAAARAAAAAVAAEAMALVIRELVRRRRLGHLRLHSPLADEALTNAASPGVFHRFGQFDYNISIRVEGQPRASVSSSSEQKRSSFGIGRC